MESRLRVFLLIGLAAATTGCSLFGRDQPPMTEPGASEPVISPEVERREVRQQKIDTENFQIGGFAGLISVEDFGSDAIYGVRARYLVTEGLFVEGTYGKTGTLGKTSAEILGEYSLLDDSREYEYYDISLGYNLLPGESFIGRNWAFNSSLYVVGGVGQTSLGLDDYFTMTFGAGYQVLPTDWLALDFGVRDHIFESEFTSGVKNSTHNIELTMGISVFF